MFRLLTTTCVKFDPCERGRASNLLVGFSRRPGQPVAPGGPGAARGGAEPYNVGLTAGQHFFIRYIESAIHSFKIYLFLFDK